MKIKKRIFNVTIPTLGSNTIAKIIPISIPMEWDDEINEWLMTEEGDRLIKETKIQYEEKSVIRN